MVYLAAAGGAPPGGLHEAISICITAFEPKVIAPVYVPLTDDAVWKRTRRANERLKRVTAYRIDLCWAWRPPLFPYQLHYSAAQLARAVLRSAGSFMSNEPSIRTS
jgi:hypothetical protein